MAATRTTLRQRPQGARAPGERPVGSWRPSPTIDYRAHPDLYRIGRGEQGVLTVEPYKSELLPHWRFKTPAEARESAARLYAIFLDYRAAGDIVGMDMARKFVQMGYTRARRYAVHKSGRKWAPGRTAVLPPDPDPVKAEAAAVFRETLGRIMADEQYLAARRRHQAIDKRADRAVGNDYPPRSPASHSV